MLYVFHPRGYSKRLVLATGETRVDANLGLSNLYMRRFKVNAWSILAAAVLSVGGGASLIAGGEVSTETFGTGEHRFSMDFVPVEDLGNPADPSVGVRVGGSVVYTNRLTGSVNYSFRMGKHEVSEGMIRHANAAGSLPLTVTTWGDDYPAGKLVFYELAQFVNWLNVITGHHPAYNFRESGEWVLWPSSEAWQLGGENLYRHREAYFFVPSIDEWHKASYWDPVAHRYWKYPTGSDTPPVPVASGTEPGTAVYGQPTAQGPASIYQAGGLSPFGTMGQGGNIHDTLETAYDSVNDSTSELHFLRGGWWIRPAGNLASDASDQVVPWLIENPNAGPGQGGSHEGGGAWPLRLRWRATRTETAYSTLTN